MKRLSFLTLTLFLYSSMNAQSVLKGDMNDDGQITIADVTMLVDIILGKTPSETIPAQGIIIDGHECVNLGLSSGTLWAATNLGADSPEDYGNFFAWGDTTGNTSGNSSFSWISYIWSGHTFDSLTKYCNNSSYGIQDNLTELELADDAAYMTRSRQWRIPTDEQLQELLNECTWTWTTLNGINGYEVKGSNGNAIFLPAAGVYSSEGYEREGSYVSFWTRSLYQSSTYNALLLSAWDNSEPSLTYGLRYYGRTIRPVAYIK